MRQSTYREFDKDTLSRLTRAIVCGICLGMMQSPAYASDEINIRTQFRADGEYCYLYHAVAKGLFQREGVNVRIDEGQNAVQVLQTVGAGKDFMATPDLSLLPLARAQGAHVRAIAVLGQQHPAGVVVQGSGDVHSVRQLVGKTILVGPGAGATLLAPFLRLSGVDPKSVHVVTTDHGTKMQSFLAKKADAAGIFSDNLPDIRKQDPKARFFPYRDVLSLYGVGLVVHEKTIEERPRAVAAAVRGVLAAERDALKNPEHCIDSLVAAFPGRNFDRTLSLNKLKEHQKLLTQANERLGRMTDERWKQIETVLVQHFGLKTTAASVATYYTNEFLPSE